MWLANSELGAAVGVESLDDVVVMTAENAILEQDKLSWSRNPIPDRSENFWKTLAIWLGLIKDGERDLANTQFHLVSTFRVTTGIASELKKPVADRDIQQVITLIRSIADQPNEEWSKYSSFVAAKNDAELAAFLNCILIVDEVPASDHDGANLRLATSMRVPTEITAEVIAGLRGWLQARVMEHFRRVALGLDERKAAWVEVDEFRQEHSRLIARHFNKRLVLKAASQIAIEPEDRERHKGAMFVRQLGILGIQTEEPERILEAIEDYLKGVDERSRLAIENGVTQQVFQTYETSLVDHWRTCKRVASRKSFATEEIAGQEILDQSLAYQAYLDGLPVTENYLTRGTFHKLADHSSLSLGWHPKYKQLLTSHNEPKE